MVERIVNDLNNDRMSYCIADLYEEEDTDYVLLLVEKEILVALEVVYNSGEVSFLRLCQSKKDKLKSIFSDRNKNTSFANFAILV